MRGAERLAGSPLRPAKEKAGIAGIPTGQRQERAVNCPNVRRCAREIAASTPASSTWGRAASTQPGTTRGRHRLTTFVGRARVAATLLWLASSGARFAATLPWPDCLAARGTGTVSDGSASPRRQIFPSTAARLIPCPSSRAI